MSDYPPHHLIWMICASGASMPVLEPIVTPPRLAGRLTITVKKAKKLYDAARIGKMDPYAELKIGDEKKRTSVHKKGDVEPVWEERLEFVLSGEESSLRVRVHNKTLLSNSLIGTARLPLDYLVVLHASLTAAVQQSPASSNVDSHTFWVELGRENRQAVPAGAVLLSVDGFVFDRDEDRDAMREALTRQFDRRSSLPSILRPDVHSKENSQTEADRERERKEAKPQSVSADGSSLAPVQHPPPVSTVSSTTASSSASHSASSSTSQPVLTAERKNVALQSPPPRPGPPSLPSTGQSSSASSSPHPSFFQHAGSSPHSRQSSLPVPAKARLFGGPLSNGIARSKSSVPVVVYVCVQYLVYHGLQTVGLFRISPSSVVVDAIKVAFENGDSVNISDPHATAAVLKSYFRELQEPLIPYDAFARFVAAIDSRDAEASFVKLREAVQALEEDNRVVLSFLVHFLTLVAAQQGVNRMSPRNLAVVWAPNLLRGPNSVPDLAAPDAQALAREMHRAEECIALLIEGYAKVFPEGPPRPFQLDHPQKERPQPQWRFTRLTR